MWPIIWTFILLGLAFRMLVNKHTRNFEELDVSQSIFCLSGDHVTTVNA